MHCTGTSFLDDSYLEIPPEFLDETIILGCDDTIDGMKFLSEPDGNKLYKESLCNEFDAFYNNYSGDPDEYDRTSYLYQLVDPSEVCPLISGKNESTYHPSIDHCYVIPDSKLPREIEPPKQLRHISEVLSEERDLDLDIDIWNRHEDIVKTEPLEFEELHIKEEQLSEEEEEDLSEEDEQSEDDDEESDDDDDDDDDDINIPPGFFVKRSYAEDQSLFSQPLRRNARRNTTANKGRKSGMAMLNVRKAAQCALKRSRITELPIPQKRRKITNSVETTPSSSDCEEVTKYKNRGAKYTAIRAINNFNSSTKAVKSEVQRTNHNRNEKRRREVMSDLMKSLKGEIPVQYFTEKTDKGRAKASKQKILTACVNYVVDSKRESRDYEREKKQLRMYNNQLRMAFAKLKN